MIANNSKICINIHTQHNLQAWNICNCINCSATRDHNENNIIESFNLSSIFIWLFGFVSYISSFLWLLLFSLAIYVEQSFECPLKDPKRRNKSILFDWFNSKSPIKIRTWMLKIRFGLNNSKIQRKTSRESDSSD